MPQTTRPNTATGVAEVTLSQFAGADRAKPVILACVDRSRHGRRVLAHVGALARAVGGQIILMRVLDPHSGNDLPPDPVDWEVRRREAGYALARMAERGGIDARIILAQGRPSEEICHEAARLGAEYIVLGRFGEEVEDMDRTAGIGATARAILEQAQEKVLLVPEGDRRVPCFRRILVPLDGSCWAESALPTAMRVAGSTNAEIVLAQIMTPPEFVCPTPPEPEDVELRARITERNNRAARGYLERQRAMLAEQGVTVRKRVVDGADARGSLLELLREDAYDLVVLSARGSGFRHLPGLHFGSVAAHLSLHSATPLLFVRPDTDVSQRRSGRRAVATAPPPAALHA
ncbi:universal stress protein [Alkalilacustris brevis]|uniref:universal stress protein n=1 Tax=Alkalilacustris brevis TaxID=2026338 RepID=UPI000E0CD9C7|nr:universal stress protein [Alkalilacustris brevis]